MKLVTFQTMDALKELINKGYLECNQKFINLEKAAPTYKWVIEEMNRQIENPTHTKYPLWCWVKFKNGICPPKHKGKKVEGFDIKITFHKEEKYVFITDFRRFSFLLNNRYIPDTKKDQKYFEKMLQRYQITEEELKAYVRKDKYKECRNDKDFLEVCDYIKKSFSKCITKESDCLQGCVWKIDLSEVENIEILNDSSYIYGSFNYVRNNGKRHNWIKEYLKNLK